MSSYGPHIPPGSQVVRPLAGSSWLMQPPPSTGHGPRQAAPAPRPRPVYGPGGVVRNHRGGRSTRRKRSRNKSKRSYK